MRTRLSLYLAIAVCCCIGAKARAVVSPPAAALGAGVREALLWYEDCESPAGQNKDLGIRINSPTLVEGKIGKAFLLERRDANVLASPDFDFLDGWIAVGHPELRKSGGWSSPACVRITENDYVRQVVTELSVAEPAWCCLSAYAKSDSPGARLELRVDREIVKEFPVTSDYSRFVLSFKAAHDNSTIIEMGRSC